MRKGRARMIPYVREMTVEYGRAEPVSPLITRVLAENPGPFTFHGTGTYIVGHTVLAVIDPGPPLDAHLDALRQAIGQRPVSHILTTHTHMDHSPLARRLQAITGAEIVGRAAPHPPTAADEADFQPDVEVRDGQIVFGPGWSLEAVFTPGHASNHVGYALAEEQAFFCGDHVMGWSTTVVSPPDGDMSAYYDSLDRVQARGFSTLWPTHGPPIHDVDAFLDGYREHRLQREAQILRELARGPRRIADLTPRLYVGVDARLHAAAARSLWAHLIHLCRTGRADADGAPTQDAIWSLPAT
jgi:glyoxylase-like metal-dependent hydrolase (beta-lactamase superfamily II)